MEMVLYSRLCPLCFPVALSKRACHPDPRGPLEGEASHGLARNTGLAGTQSLLPSPSSEPEGQPRDGGGGQRPPPGISFCKYSALIKLYSRQAWPPL